MPERYETFMNGKLDESWFEYAKVQTVWARQMEYDFEVDTLEGVMQGHAGDYMCVGSTGERWPIRKDIFEKTYKLVGDKHGGEEELVTDKAGSPTS